MPCVWPFVSGSRRRAPAASARAARGAPSRAACGRSRSSPRPADARGSTGRACRRGSSVQRSLIESLRRLAFCSEPCGSWQSWQPTLPSTIGWCDGLMISPRTSRVARDAALVGELPLRRRVRRGGELGALDLAVVARRLRARGSSGSSRTSTSTLRCLAIDQFSSCRLPAMAGEADRRFLGRGRGLGGRARSRACSSSDPAGAPTRRHGSPGMRCRSRRSARRAPSAGSCCSAALVTVDADRHFARCLLCA